MTELNERVMELLIRSNGNWNPDPEAVSAFVNLLAYLDNHEDANERALGQMLRKGVEPVRASAFDELQVCIDTPDGREVEFGEVPLYRIKEEQ